MNILITGSAGFIGFHLSYALLKKNYKVIGIDNLNDYYSTNLKKQRLKKLKENKKFIFYKTDINNKKSIKKIFATHKPKIVINLAAYAGVRHSFLKPEDYIETNISGFHNLINLSVKFKIKHFIYASSSSIYGDIKKTIFSEKDKTVTPISLYGASKMSNELIAYSYSKLHKIKSTGLRFFTVYGPYGRPDMALYLFANSIKKSKPLYVFNYGRMSRDFTYVDDVVSAICIIIEKEKVKRNISETYNIGYGKTVPIMKFIKEIENNFKKKAKIKFLPMQKGDVKSSNANIKKILIHYNFKPKFSYKLGIAKFIEWFKDQR